MRVRIWKVAYSAAAPSARSAAGVSISLPGRTINNMPRRPAATNAKRARVTRSRNNQAAISVTNIGAVKFSAVA